MKYIKKTIFEVDYNDLDEAITEFLKSKGINAKSECVADNEWSNDESHSFDVDGKLDDYFEKYDKPEILKGDISWKLGSILNWMCAENVIEPGEYLVKISW